MAASVITGLFLFFCLLQSASAELQEHVITAHPGDDVTLSCRAPNVIIRAVEWSRSDLERHVYFQSDGYLNTADQDPSYVNRVQLKDDEMKNGELSLILKNVNNNDEGTYECRYEERGRWKSGGQIKLVVIRDAVDPQRHQITVEAGDNVTLSCKAPNVTITAVEWIRSDPERLVYLKRDGHLETAGQDPSYVNRVQLKDDEMKNGELSLILKNVNNSDGGRYECRYKEIIVRRKRALIDGEPISTVYLKVTDPQTHNITAQPGENVTLSCEAPNNAVITAVEWIRSDPNKHVYLKRDGHLNTTDQDPSYVNRVQLKDDEMKKGELSLILKNVNNNDGGRYECRYKEKTGGRRKRSDQSKLISTIYLNVKGGNSRDGKHSEDGKLSGRRDSSVIVPDLNKPRQLGVILPVTLIAALVVVGLVGFVIYKKRKGRSKKKPDLPVDDPDVLQQLQEN